MNSSVTLSWPALIGIIAICMIVGYVIGKTTRLSSSVRVNVSASPAGAAGSGGVTIQRIKLHDTPTSRNLEIRCQCSATYKFHDGSGPAEPGAQPMPTGDSFTCPSCGRTINLQAARQAESDALARLNLPKH